MAWTAPKSWTTGYKVLASDMNTFVSDNDAALRAGGLSVTSQAANDILYASSSTQLARSSTFVFDGSNLGIGISNPAFYVTAVNGEAGAQYTINSTHATYTGSALKVGAVRAASTAYNLIYTATGTAAGGSSGTASFIVRGDGQTTIAGNLGVNTSSVKATAHVKAPGNNWEDGLLLEHNSGDTGWDIHPENNGDNALFFGYNADTSVGLTAQTATTVLALEGGGNVGVGTAAPEELLHIDKDQAAVTALKITNDNAGGNVSILFDTPTGRNNRITSEGNLGLGTAGTADHLFIDASGNVALAANLDVAGTAEIVGNTTCGSTTGGNRVFAILSTLSSDALFSLQNIAAAHVGTENVLEIMSSGYDIRNVGIQSDGDIINTNDSYGGISDERIKQDIRDAYSQWDDIKALQVRNFNMKGSTLEQIGVIGQEVEAAGMNKLISFTAPDAFQIANCGIDANDTVRTVKYSILYMKAIKALQEAMIRIEALESGS